MTSLFRRFGHARTRRSRRLERRARRLRVSLEPMRAWPTADPRRILGAITRRSGTSHRVGCCASWHECEGLSLAAAANAFLGRHDCAVRWALRTTSDRRTSSSSMTSRGNADRARRVPATRGARGRGVATPEGGGTVVAFGRECEGEALSPCASSRRDRGDPRAHASDHPLTPRSQRSRSEAVRCGPRLRRNSVASARAETYAHPPPDGSASPKSARRSRTPSPRNRRRATVLTLPVSRSQGRARRARASRSRSTAGSCSSCAILPRIRRALLGSRRPASLRRMDRLLDRLRATRTPRDRRGSAAARCL